MNKLDPLASLRYFRHDLLVFFSEHELDSTIVADLNVFGRFLFFYVSLIEQTPLIAPTLGLSNLDQLGVSVQLLQAGRAPGRPDEEYMFSLAWTAMKSGADVFNFTAEVWFPKQPVFDMIPLAGESKTFWD